MAGFTYTEEQKQGIFHRGEDILISAAAGSGKTRVLIDRIVEMIVNEGCSIRECLVVTFTRAAAGEMRERLEKGLHEALQLHPEKASHIRKEIRYLPQAHISTLHAFCIDQLRAYFHAVNLSPKFAMISPSQEAVYKNQALAEIMEEAYESKDPAFERFISGYGGNRDDKRVLQMVSQLAYFIQTMPKPRLWLEENIERYQGLEDNDIFLETFRDFGQLYLDLALDSLKDMEQEVENLILDDEAKIPFTEVIQADGQVITDLQSTLEAREWAQFWQKANVSWMRLATNKAPKEKREEYKEVYDGLKKMRENVKKTVKKVTALTESYAFTRIPEERQRVYPFLCVLKDLVCRYLDRYAELKRKENLLDFNDAEHFMLELLEQESFAESIRKDIKYIFFDEYQDANPVQEEIVRGLASPGNLFFVGDVKQAIYRFRLSDPAIFNHRYACYQENPEAGCLIFLSKNFRSEPNVLEFCNFIFSYLMTPELGEVNYLEKGQALVPGRVSEEKPCPFTLHLIEEQEESEEDREVEVIAREIQKLVREGRYNYRDIAILMRSPRNTLEAFEASFKAHDIPYFTDNTTVSFHNTEVNIFLEVLKCINHDGEDTSLLATLLSPFGGFVELELADIRCAYPEWPFYMAFEAYYEEKDDALQQKIHTFKERLNLWRSWQRDYQLGEFARMLLDKTGYGAFVLALSNGRERYENLKAFIQLLDEFGESSATGLVGFLQDAETLVKEKADGLSPALNLSEEDNCVRIMSIHKSKGLEFPVVFLANTSKRFNFQDTNGILLLEGNIGLATKIVDDELGTIYSSFEKNILAQYQRALTSSEEVRLLYVALTRAVKEIHWFGKVKNIDDSLAKAAVGSLKLKLHQGSSYLDWLLAILSQDALGRELFATVSQGPAKGDFYGLSQNRHKAEEIFNVAFHREEEEGEDREFEPQALENLVRDEALLERIKKYFSAEYPYLEETKRPLKRTVSDLAKDRTKASADYLEAAPYVKTQVLPSRLMGMPDFLQEHISFTAAEQGTILHKVMEKIPLKAYANTEELAEALQDLETKGFLEPRERETVSVQMLEKFFRHPLGKRIVQAAEAQLLEREKSFTMVLEETFVDGQIDLFFETEEGYIVVDFKSDREIDEKKYRLQLELYSQAVAEAYGKPVKEKWLYWLRHGVASLVEEGK